MDTKLLLQKWIQRMELNVNIPETSLSKICSSNTALIWEQLIELTKPRYEVEILRNNIHTQQLKRQNTVLGSLAKVQKLELLGKKRKLKLYVEKMAEKTKETIFKIDQKYMQNNLKYMQLENLRRVKVLDGQRTFWLSNKSKDLEEQINRINDILLTVTNLTPVEEEEGSDNTEVLDTLNKCAMKIKELIDIGKKGIHRNLNEKDIIKSNLCFPYSHSIIGNSLMNSSSNKSYKIGKENKHSFVSEYSGIKRKPLLENDFNGSLGLICDDDLSNLSVTSFFVPQEEPATEFVILSDSDLMKSAEELLHKNCRSTIVTCLEGMCQTKTAEFLNALTAMTKPQSSNENMDAVAPKLYAVQIKNDLDSMKHSLNAECLMATLGKYSEDINLSLESQYKDTPNQVEQAKNTIQLQQEEAGLTAALTCLQSELAKLRQATPNTAKELRQITEEKKSLMEKQQHRMHVLERKVSQLQNFGERIQEIRENSSSIVRKLNPFSSSTCWLSSLEQHFVLSELEAFSNYPLGYNASFESSGSKIYLRDEMRTVPYSTTLDANTMCMLSTLLGCCANLPDAILLNLMHRKNNLDVLRCQPDVQLDRGYRKFTLQELRSKEAYLDEVLEKFENTFRKGPVGQHYLALVKESARVWVEMPLKNHVPASLLHNGKSYKEYETDFNSYLSEL